MNHTIRVTLGLHYITPSTEVEKDLRVVHWLHWLHWYLGVGKIHKMIVLQEGGT